MKRNVSRFLLVLLVPAALAAGVVFWMLRPPRAAAFGQIERATQIVALGIKLQLTAEIKGRAARIAHIAVEEGQPSSEVLEREAQQLSLRFPDMEMIAWTGAEGKVRSSTAPRREALDAEALAGKALPTCDIARGRLEPIVASVTWPNGVTHLIVCAPVPAGDGGFLIGAFRRDRMLDALLRNAAREYGLAVFEGRKPIYTRQGMQLEKEWAQQAQVRVPEVNWRVAVWPGEQQLARAGISVKPSD